MDLRLKGVGSTIEKDRVGDLLVLKSNFEQIRDQMVGRSLYVIIIQSPITD